MKNPITYCKDVHCTMGAACCGCPGHRDAIATHNASLRLPNDMQYNLVEFGKLCKDIDPIGGVLHQRMLVPVGEHCTLVTDTPKEFLEDALPIIWHFKDISEVNASRITDMHNNLYDRVFDGRILVSVAAKPDIPDEARNAKVQRLLASIPPAMRNTLPEDDTEAALEWAIRMMGV